ncbi:MAG TPA: ATP-binding cassette domain-containing protein [Dehalococcoidia bacterium]|nr:ATP-binding cassette domain-containing protein [Dehalococcoidia bacterium]
MAIIETIELTRRFGELTAVDNLTVSVQLGEVFGLLGPNGAGKTTVIKMLTTLLRPTSGEARIAGFSITRNGVGVRRIIGYVPQLLSADSTLTGYENLMVFAKLYDIPRAERKSRIMEALSFMRLEEAANKLVRTYSGGMIRRLEIIQSILHRPRVLFLDEPTVGLDPLARKALWEHIDKLRAEYGTTIFLTTHLMEEADSLCSRVAIMHHGKLVALGTPAELKVSIGVADATLDDVFIHFTGDVLESGGGYRETSRTRRTAKRLG